MIPEVTTQTQEVLARHMQALASSSDVIVQDYTEESVLLTQNGTFTGLAAIRAFFDASNVNELVKLFQLHHQIVQGNVAYIVWSAEPLIKLGTDTFVIEDGKIKVQTVAFYAG